MLHAAVDNRPKYKPMAMSIRIAPTSAQWYLPARVVGRNAKQWTN